MFFQGFLPYKCKFISSKNHEWNISVINYCAYLKGLAVIRIFIYFAIEIK